MSWRRTEACSNFQEHPTPEFATPWAGNDGGERRATTGGEEARHDRKRRKIYWLMMN